jgi:hypothetical protein
MSAAVSLIPVSLIGADPVFACIDTKTTMCREAGDDRGSWVTDRRPTVVRVGLEWYCVRIT